MKNFFSHFYLFLLAFTTVACHHEDAQALPPVSNGAMGKTLVIYYSYTNNSKEIAETLVSQIASLAQSETATDALRIEPAQKGLDYAANGYALGSQLINAIKSNPNSESSYPAIDPVTVTWNDYASIIIVTPLWWSQMAAPMQTFLFKYGEQLADKNVGLIVSSHSSGISGVEADCKRLLPSASCSYLSKSLWISASNHSNRASLISNWLNEVNYKSILTQSEVMNITINGKTAICNLEDNVATQALLQRLSQGSVTYTANEYGGFEMVGYIGFSLPTNNSQITTSAGDVVLYNGNNICIFADSNSWSYTPIGKIEGMSADELRTFLCMDDGSADITLSLNSSAISSISAPEHLGREKGIFSLSGQRLNQAPEKGIYIEDGVKKIK